MMINIAGLVLNLVGVIILFRWGMPFRVRSGGVTYRITNQIDAKEVATERRYKIIGYFGLALLIMGTVLQIAAAT
jgi:hypothetical protein